MLTRMEYIERKTEIDARMKQTRRDERQQRKAIDDARIEQDKLEFQEYLERKRQRAIECKEKCDEITEHFKNVRRQLWTEDVELVEEWRAGLRQSEVDITPPHTTGGLTKEDPRDEE